MPATWSLWSRRCPGSMRRRWRRTSACRSTKAPRSTTRRSAPSEPGAGQSGTDTLRRLMNEAPPISTTLPELPAEPAPRAPRVMLLVSVIAIAMSLYHMYVALVGPPETFFFRGTHLAFALVLVFLLYPAAARGRIGVALDTLLLAASVGIVDYILVNH